MRTPTTPDHSGALLSLKDVAAWQIAGIQPQNPSLRAALPALQRGAVWRAPQVEALWDSVLRGFPVGAFLLAPFEPDKGVKQFIYARGESGPAAPTHHLLDGQQRSNALALGFLDLWRPGLAPAPPAALWIDLEAPNPKDERDVVFRVLTRSHPWGYRYNSLAGEGPRLSADMMRKAVQKYAESSPALQGKGAGEIPLNAVWPWDAVAPVPLCFLLDAVQTGGEVQKHLRRRLEVLPFWKEGLPNAGSQDWTGRVLEILGASSGDDWHRFDRIVDRVSHVVGKRETGSYRIPALIIPEIMANYFGADALTKKRSPEEAERKDPMETLFVRINSSGTPLAGEELVYSILKSIWPAAEGFVEGIHTRLAQPSRIVVLAARLVLATEDVYLEKPPGSPDVSRFRRLVNGADRESPKFRKKIVDFFKSGRAGEVFTATRDLLTDNPWCPLPAVLAADLARRSPDVMFLLLRWVHRLLDNEQDPRKLGKPATLRALGAVTALSWFSEDEGHCLTSMWPEVQRASERSLPHVLCKGFAPCFGLNRGKLAMIPLVPPKVLQSALDANILERHGFGTHNTTLWQRWTWEDLVSLPVDHKWLGGKLGVWYRSGFKKLWALGEREISEEEGSDVDGIYQQAWISFMDTLHSERRLLLFAQRTWLNAWFPRYDPTAPDQLDEHDRPWDFDHIHPNVHIVRRKNVPQMIRTWHGSIGNLRAWPFQANRGDGDRSPREKLTQAHLGAFKIHTPADLLHASVIEDAHDLDWWNASTPEDDSYPPGYLGDGENHGTRQRALLRAILGRLVRIYGTWYETLMIEDLYG